MCNIIPFMSNTRILQGLGEGVRRARRSQGRTAKDVAQSAGLSSRFYAQLEAGQANISILRLHAVAEALGVLVSSLLGPQDATGSVVALLGIRGAGKSTVGAALAARWEIDFIELDVRIEQRAGLSLSEIFTLYGEEYYRRMESLCLEELLESQAHAVVALSGGVVHNPDAFERIQGSCRTVWLKARPDDYMKRVLEQGDYRPVANREDAMAELKTLVAKREPLYTRADFVVDTSARTSDEVVSAIAEQLSC